MKSVYIIASMFLFVISAMAQELPPKVISLVSPSSWVIVEDSLDYQRLMSGDDIAERTIASGVPQSILALVNDTVYVKHPDTPVRILIPGMINNLRRNFNEYIDMLDAISMFPAIRDTLNLPQVE